MSLTIDFWTNQSTGDLLATVSFKVSITTAQEDLLTPEGEEQAIAALQRMAEEKLEQWRSEGLPVNRIYEHGFPG